MKDFTIHFDPPLRQLQGREEDADLKNLGMSLSMYNDSDAINIIFRVGTLEFGYYPAAPVTILYDLVAELDMLRKKEDHRVLLSGYTVLEVHFVHSELFFLDPVSKAQMNNHEPIAGPFASADIEGEILNAISTVRRCIRDKDLR